MTDRLLAEQAINPETIARALLLESGNERPPTNPETIANYLNLRIVDFRPSDLELGEEVRAFLSPNERLIGVHRKLSTKRRTFSILHEIGHFVLPGHASHPNMQQGRIIDEGRDLSAKSNIDLEIEANKFAADCLFQLDTFDREAIVNKLSWDNIRQLAEKYGASFEATARRWVERSVHDCALIVFNPVSRKELGSPLEVLYTITSNSFRDKYFSRILPGYRVDADNLIYRLFYNLEYQEEPSMSIEIRIAGKDDTLTFNMNLFSNNYRMFGLISSPPT
jgi:Zn-dependent peptidase ImmA (M78 family)